MALPSGKAAEGYPLDAFVDKKAAESFVCSICLNVPDGTTIVDHGKCGAVFCFDCISQWMKSGSKHQNCPICKTEFKQVLLSKDSNKAVYNFVQSLKINCPGPNCSWVGTYAEIRKHLEEDKERAKTAECPYKVAGCGEVGTQEAINKHLKEAASVHANKFAEYVKRREAECVALKNQNEEIQKKALLSDPVRGGALLSKGVPTADPVVFLAINIWGICESKVYFKLYANAVPKTAENFRCLCAGTSAGADGKLLTYKGSPIHRIIPGFMLQGGDIVYKNGTGSTSIYGKTFPDENFVLKHHKEGMLSMANAGPHTNGCQFFVSFRKNEALDGKYVVFGEVVQGIEFVRELEKYGSPTGQTLRYITITDCGLA